MVANKTKKQSTLAKLASWFRLWLANNWLDIVIVSGLVALKALVHGFNYLGFPYIENDEATYAIRGLSFATNGSFDMYTYWYDHAPAGWMLIGIWFLLTGKTLIFDSYMSSARFFMLAITVATVVMTYILARRLIKDRVMALIITLVVILSPLQIYYQRRVLLDNIMTFWVLLSFLILIRKSVTAKHAFASGITLALAILTKLNAVFFAPAAIFAVWRNSHKKVRLMSMVTWLATVGSIVLLFPIYALLKGELLPVNDHPESGNFSKGISLIDTLIFQSSRGNDQNLAPWDSNSDFFVTFSEWVGKDPLFVMFAVAGFATLWWAKTASTRLKYSGLLTLAIAYIGMLVFIARGGVVLEFYFLPIFPIVIIVGMAGLMMPVYTKLIKTKPLQVFYQASVVSLIFLNYALYIPANPAFARNEVANQLKAVEWIKQNADLDATILTDNYATIYLNLESGFDNTDYNYKVEYDPEIRERLNNDWRNVDYIITTHEVLKQIRLGETPFVRDAFDHAELAASFTDDSTSFLDIPNYISTNGDWAQIWRVKDDNQIIMQDSWATFLDQNFKEYGQIIDPGSNDITTSLLQTNSMLRAVEQKDRRSFDGIWQWTQDHLQNRLQDKLLSSTWVKDDDGAYSVGNANTTSLADLQAAYALLEAHNVWGSPTDLQDALDLINDIWENEVYTIGGSRVLGAFVTNQPAQILINPSYMVPSYFKEFAKYDETHDWMGLVDSSYSALSQIQNDQTGLFPNWVKPNGAGGYQSASAEVGAVGDLYGYDAIRIPYSLAIDYDRNGDERARVMLDKLSTFFAEEMSTSGKIVASYRQDGSPAVDFEDIAPYAASYVAMFKNGDASVNESIINEKIIGQYSWRTGEWGGEFSSIINDAMLPLYLDHIEDYGYHENDYSLTIDFETKAVILLDEFGNPLPDEDQPDLELLNSKNSDQ